MIEQSRRWTYNKLPVYLEMPIHKFIVVSYLNVTCENSHCNHPVEGNILYPPITNQIVVYTDITPQIKHNYYHETNTLYYVYMYC